jgi:hypothetical protein
MAAAAAREGSARVPMLLLLHFVLFARVFPVAKQRKKKEERENAGMRE